MYACQVNMIHLLLNCLGSSNVGAIIGGVIGVLLSVVIIIIVIVIAIVAISLHLRYNRGINIIPLSVPPLGISKRFIIKDIVTFCTFF